MRVLLNCFGFLKPTPYLHYRNRFHLYSRLQISKGSNEYIFYLTELDGEIRMKKLGITKSLFNNKNEAKVWRDKILKEIHPDINNHPKSTLAMAKLNEMYNSMVGKN